ncbi:hypothetical protein PHYPSEUDO_003199 [Phytophthora pseudosyringae]|uniref:HTH psq-type domain-containing protein n=1 Tax=Phytophthora pseudosyringae TaxID=221518 RepID=A0A8T1VSH0_9STRA|nr:hypothetical protein PHYPSEUDO_003199 [Phytophthora pseudosyringae]
MSSQPPASSTLTSMLHSSLEINAPDESFPARGKRFAPEGLHRDVEAKRPSVEGPSARGVSSFTLSSRPRKRPNYLGHDERCRIIRRVDRGESQASLAREFGVTRAAICQLYKKREAILARGEPEEASEEPFPVAKVQVTPVQHLERARTAISSAEKPQQVTLPCECCRKEVNLSPPTVDTRSNTVKLLLRIMKEPGCSLAPFERAAARLRLYVATWNLFDYFTRRVLTTSLLLDEFSILIEEAFAHYDRQASLSTQSKIRSMNCSSDANFCGITLGSGSGSFLSALLQIDAKAQSGQIHVKANRDDHTSWQLEYLDVPDIITELNVVLFSTSGKGGAECKAIEALQRIGVLEHRISLVMVVCSTSGFKEIITGYPNIKVITATIDDEWTLEGGLHHTNLVIPIKNEAKHQQRN